VALNATFTANFEQFDRAVKAGVDNLRLMDVKVQGSQRALQQMTSDFDGTKLIREATLMAAAVEKIGGATKLTEAETKRYNATISDAANKMAALGVEAPDAWKKIAAETDKAADAAKRVEAGNKHAGDSMSSLSGIAAKAGAALAGAFTVGAVLNFAKDVIDLGGEINDLSQRTGIGTDAIQELKFAAEQTGATLDTMTGAIEQMGNRLTEGKVGTVDAVRSLGLSLDDLRNRKPEDAFTLIADAIREVPEPMRQTQLAMELLGKSGTEILPAIKSGMSDLRQEARDLGQVMSKDAVQGLDTLGDKWGSFIGAAKTGVGELISDLTRASQAIANLLPTRAAGGVDLENKAAMGRLLRQQALEENKPPPAVGLPGMFGPQAGFVPPEQDLKALGESLKLQKAAAEAAAVYAKAVKALADEWRKADIAQQLKMQEAAFRSLSTTERASGEVIKKIVEEYGKLRAQVGPGALPSDLEAFYRAHLPVIKGVTQLIDVTGKYATSTLPNLIKQLDDGRNMLAGFNRDGLIPVSESFAKLSATNMIPWPVESFKNAGEQITKTKDKTVDLTAGFDDLARSFSQLAQVRPFDGWIQDMAVLIQLMNISGQAGKQIAGGLSQIRAGGTANTIAGATSVAAGGISGAIAIGQATDVAGRGNRTLRGAAAGAALGTQILPGWGTVVGAVVGALVGALRNPGFEQEMHRIGKEFGVNIGEGTAREIDKLKKSFGNDRTAAEIFSIDKIAADAGGLNDQNITSFTGKLRDVFSMIETGKFTVQDARNTLDRSFGMFADHIRQSEGIASKAFQDVIKLNKEFGTNSKAIDQFVGEQTSALGDSVANLAGPLVAQFGGLADKIKAARKDVLDLASDFRTIGSSEHQVAIENLNHLLAQQQQGAASAGDELERLGVIALGAFNAAVNAGQDWLSAVEGMGPALDTLIGLQRDLGIETQNAGLAELTRFRDLVVQNQTLVTSTSALGETLRALASIGGVTTETLAAMEAQGGQTFDRLIAAGFSENQALRQMRTFLINVIEAHDQLGTPIDENTKRLTDMAKEQGLLKDGATDLVKTMQTGFAQVTGALGLVAKGLGVEIPAAIQKTIDALDEIPTDVDVNVNVKYNDPGFDPNIVVDYPGQQGASPYDVPSFASGGVGNFGSGTLAMLHGREAIVPLDRWGGSSGPTVIHVHLESEGREFAHAIVPFIPDVLALHGVAR
jgi:hypothetical protein